MRNMIKKAFSKKYMRYVHYYFSIFFLPFVLMYTGTGLMYISGYSQNAGARTYEHELDRVLTKDDAEMVKQFVLEKHNINLKSAKVIQSRNSKLDFAIFSASAQVSVKVHEHKTELKVTERRWWGTLLMMHKSKAGVIMDVFAFLTSISLVMVYISGLVMTSMAKNHRIPSTISLILGSACLIVIYLWA